jgi:glycosyltransferase involved in cell wall biosynthesis
VSFDVDGAREVVKDDLTGYLVRPKDVAGLTSTLCRLLADADLRKRLGENGRRLVDPAFRKEVMIDRMNALYETLQDEEGNRI